MTSSNWFVSANADRLHWVNTATREWPLWVDSVEKVVSLSGLRQNLCIGQQEARSIMGQLSSGQERLFYSFNLEDHIPANHLLPSIDQCLDLGDMRHYFAAFYSPIGRPSIDPELMIRMLIVGYITSAPSGGCAKRSI